MLTTLEAALGRTMRAMHAWFRSSSLSSDLRLTCPSSNKQSRILKGKADYSAPER